ncbi:MAG: hypothetical protein EZS28_049130, partial [Streblomastix strix]
MADLHRPVEDPGATVQVEISIFSSTGVTIGSAETTQAKKAGNQTPRTFYPNPCVGCEMRRFGVDAYCTGLRPQLL